MNIEQGLNYLRESLANYEEENEIIDRIRRKIDHVNAGSQLDFIQNLDEEEVLYLDNLLKQEIHYARHAHDDVRVTELTNIYSLLI